MGWGLVTATDVETLRRSLLVQLDRTMVVGEVNPNAPALRVLEVGVHTGETSRAIRDLLIARGRAIDYVGIDSQRDLPSSPPFDGARLVIGDSAEVYDQIPDFLDWVLIDGCHCKNHVMLDFLHFAPKVTVGGHICFHDVSPRAQGKCDYQGHGPRTADFGTSARHALVALGLLDLYGAQIGHGHSMRDDWQLVDFIWDNQDWGGIAVVERIL